MTSLMICGQGDKPKLGQRVPLRAMLHDNGFGACIVMVRGLYGYLIGPTFPLSALGEAVAQPAAEGR